MRYSKMVILVLLSVIAVQSKKALCDGNTANITVKVVINSSPCTVNNNQTIDVDFGNSIITTDVAKGTVEKTVDYTLDCTSADQNQKLAMKISGVGADFDNNVLKTNIAELGVKLRADGIDYPLNTDLVLATTSSKPMLVAQLIQQPGARLSTGSFTAGATMTVSYQ